MKIKIVLTASLKIIIIASLNHLETKISGNDYYLIALSLN